MCVPNMTNLIKKLDIAIINKSYCIVRHDVRLDFVEKHVNIIQKIYKLS